MKQKKGLPKESLRKILADQSILEAIHRGRYTEVIEHDEPAKNILNGRSSIISYYQAGKYICTKHELRKGDEIVHQDVEAVFVTGTLYVRA